MLEFERRIPIQGWKTALANTRRRIVDLVVRTAKGVVYCEVKRWTEVPSPTAEQYLKAVDQMRRDLVLAAKEGETAGAVCWLFIVGEGLLESGQVRNLATRFAQDLDKDADLAIALGEVLGAARDSSRVTDLIRQLKDLLESGGIFLGVT